MTCFWAGDAAFEAVCLCLGLPCFAAIGYCVLSAYGVRLCLPDALAAPKNDAAPLKSAYGMLLDVSDVSVDVDKVVETWVMRGVAASILYAVLLLALACTTVLHMNAGISMSFSADGLVATLMCGCKLTVGVCAHHVHRRLSRLSRTVTGSWVLGIALSMDAMALCALGIVATYLRAEFDFRAAADFCELGYVFCWSLFLSMGCQSCAAFALFRIQERAEVFVADRHVFSRIIGNHWSALVSGTFGVGVGLWIVGALFVFSRRYSLDPFKWMGLVYLLAAGCQAVSGLSMLSINNAVRKYFQSPEGKASLAAAAEMASDASGDVMDSAAAADP
eukprot:CAMPEP_0113818746 /NCGR_PEP_ID=MMETSP0328-20130328/394_1 /TAXON_ID=39455 /ORGANISM="Alexandrium minutum" /LENGTH=332 /DNA_ID=CAMNT_0000786681 /DNA_START=53 /DNA_END=1048 /DNA_ORIENTATION=- /assembly_acc=CAM_ASM_000350